MDVWTHASTRRGAARLPILPAPPIQATPEQTTFIAAEYPAEMRERDTGRIKVTLDNRDEASPMMTVEFQGNITTTGILNCGGVTDLFGDVRRVMVTVDLAGGGFKTELIRGSDRPLELDGPRETWLWLVETTAPGPWVVDVVVDIKIINIGEKPDECTWANGNKLSIGVPGTSFFRWGRLGIGSILGGFLGWGFTVPFFYMVGKDWWSKRPKEPPSGPPS